MKELVAAIGKALAGLKQQELSCEFDRIAKTLAGSKAKKIDVIAEALRQSNQNHQVSSGVKLGSLLPVFSVFYEVFIAAGARKKSVTDLKALLDLFGEYQQLSIDEFCLALTPITIGARAVDHQLVDTYLDRLEKVLGDEQQFPLVYKSLTADKRVAQPEAVELASRFLAPIAKSTSRPKALRRVLYRHEKLLESRAASASITARR